MPHIGGSHNALHRLQLTFPPTTIRRSFPLCFLGETKKGAAEISFDSALSDCFVKCTASFPDLGRDYFWKKALTRSAIWVTSSSFISAWMGSERTSWARRTDSAMLPHVRATHL